MDLMLIGSSQAEKALLTLLMKNSRVDKVYLLPGSPDMRGNRIRRVPIREHQVTEMTDFALMHQIDLALVTGRQAQFLGAVTEMEAAGVPVFGLTQLQAEYAASPDSAEKLMKANGIPVCAVKAVRTVQEAAQAAEEMRFPIAVFEPREAQTLFFRQKEEASDAFSAWRRERRKFPCGIALSSPGGPVLRQCYVFGGGVPSPLPGASVRDEITSRVAVPLAEEFRKKTGALHGIMTLEAVMTQDGPSLLRCIVGMDESAAPAALEKADGQQADVILARS